MVPASEIIETAEPPVMAIRKKKDSSLKNFGFYSHSKETADA